MKIHGDSVIFESTGRRDYANRGILGIGPKLDTSGGYDQGFPNSPSKLTQEEREELADHAIALWTAYRAAST